MGKKVAVYSPDITVVFLQPEHRPTHAVVPTAIDYSDSSMSEARNCLETIRTFLSAAQAYMKGQLHCSPVQEDLLWGR